MIYGMRLYAPTISYMRPCVVCDITALQQIIVRFLLSFVNVLLSAVAAAAAAASSFTDTVAVVYMSSILLSFFFLLYFALFCYLFVVVVFASGPYRYRCQLCCRRVCRRPFVYPVCLFRFQRVACVRHQSVSV